LDKGVEEEGASEVEEGRASVVALVTAARRPALALIAVWGMRPIVQTDAQMRA
jgi:hypothetical protein